MGKKNIGSERPGADQTGRRIFDMNCMSEMSGLEH